MGARSGPVLCQSVQKRGACQHVMTNPAQIRTDHCIAFGERVKRPRTWRSWRSSGQRDAVTHSDSHRASTIWRSARAAGDEPPSWDQLTISEHLAAMLEVLHSRGALRLPPCGLHVVHSAQDVAPRTRMVQFGPSVENRCQHKVLLNSHVVQNSWRQHGADMLPQSVGRRRSRFWRI